MKFFIKDFFSIFLHLLKKSLTENFIFCVVLFSKYKVYLIFLVSIFKFLNFV